MDWSSLVGVVVGGLLAAGVGWLTQRRAANQATAKEARDREHEQQVWARNLRHQTHAQFLLEFARLSDAALQFDIAVHGGEASADQPGTAMLWAVDVQLTMLELLADASTYEKARTAFHALSDYAITGSGDYQLVSQLLSEYVAAVRAESKLGPLAPPGAQLAEG